MMIDDTKELEKLGQDGNQILRSFRKVAKSYSLTFKATKDHIYNLLGPSQNYSSGIFREGLLKEFLRNVLPRSISIDSGFIYGFERISNSKQLDIIIWDSSKHAAVYSTKDFVIVTPESVIAVVSVKSTLEDDDIESGLENLLSISPLDFVYRGAVDNQNHPLFLSIAKFLISFRGPCNPDTALHSIAGFYKRTFTKNSDLSSRLIPVLQNINPVSPSEEHRFQIQRIFPLQIASIESSETSFLIGYGPANDLLAEKQFGPGLRRMPYLYPQASNLTSPLEKLVYYLLAYTYRTLGTQGWSLASAWADLNPVIGGRVGDAYEMDEDKGVELIDANNVAGF